MPNPHRYKTKHGYISPAPGNLPERGKSLLAKVYGECRVRNPGEVKENKAKCARIAWSVVKRNA
jgi:hypothetical protein